jgi:hypothetical protein
MGVPEWRIVWWNPRIRMAESPPRRDPCTAESYGRNMDVFIVRVFIDESRPTLDW